MGSKRSRLKEAVQQHARRPVPHRLLDAAPKVRSFRIVSFSLYKPEADWIDETTQALRDAGNPKANRSLVVREAVLRLQDQLKNKTSADIAQDFTQQQARRARKS